MKQQIIKFRVVDEVKTKNALLEVPFTHVAYVIKGGGGGRLYNSGTYNVFDDRKEYKNWGKGLSVDIICPKILL